MRNPVRITIAFDRRSYEILNKIREEKINRRVNCEEGC